MNRATLPSALALLLALAACGSGTRPEAAPAPPEPAPVAPAAAPSAAPPTPAPEPEPSAEQLPLEDDFAPQAEQQITAENYRRELDALERDIRGDVHK